MSVLSWSCAVTSPTVQPRVNSLLIARRYDQALALLGDNPRVYGFHNRLLFFLDAGLVAQEAGHYEQSLKDFARAKEVYDELYTRSMTRIGASWFWNDYVLPYRGEDYERVQVNIFQALNYAMIGDIPGALVEARDVDSILNAINLQYPAECKNAYYEDAFARLLMGLLYESSDNPWDRQEAYVSYRKALEIYEKDYQGRYGIAAPRILKENLLRLSRRFFEQDYREYRRRFGLKPSGDNPDPARQAEVILVQYYGLAPIKVTGYAVVPLPSGPVTKMAFPRYKKRHYFREDQFLIARNLNTGKELRGELEAGQDLEQIAIRNLADRKARILFKALARPAAKYLAEREVEQDIREKHGKDAAGWFRTGASLYNLYTEQADLRSWQTLPAQIRLARIWLPPGDYQLALDSLPLGSVSLRPGQIKWLLVHSPQ